MNLSLSLTLSVLCTFPGQAHGLLSIDEVLFVVRFLKVNFDEIMQLWLSEQSHSEGKFDEIMRLWLSDQTGFFLDDLYSKATK